MRPCRWAVCAAVGLAAAAGVPVERASAQIVRGHVVDDADRPVPGVFVILAAEEGGEVDRSLTQPDGAYLVRAPRAGTYRLTIERIGFENETTGPLALGAGESVARRLVATVRPVRLTELDVEADEGRCGALEEDARELVLVWEEVRKALAATAWTDRQSYYRFDILLVRRELNADAEPTGPPEFEPIRVYGRHPFRAIRPDDLAYGGWIQPDGARGLKFFAPDADVLMSESFTSRHCFRLVEGPRSSRSSNRLVGLEFRPTPDRRIADIAGIMWVDPVTAELLSLDFRYERTRLPVESEHLGGHVEFDRLPDGGWIVRRWEIVTPIGAVHRARRFSGGRSARVRLAGLRLEGQVVTAVWRTGDLSGDAMDVLPADVPPVLAPPDVLLLEYPPPE